jgi:AcrR family transcriptional regulator
VPAVPTPTWSKLPEDKRRRISDAALAEFSRHGFSGGSLNVVARDAGIAKGSLFQYFADKLELFTAACEWCSERVRDHMVASLGGRDPGEPLFDVLRALVGVWIDYFAANPVDRGVTLAANFEIDPDVRATVRAVTNRHYLEVLRPMVDEAKARGELRADVDADHLLALLLLLLPHLALAPSAPDLDPVLRLAAREQEDRTRTARGLIDALERAFSTAPAGQLPLSQPLGIPPLTAPPAPGTPVDLP